MPDRRLRRLAAAVVLIASPAVAGAQAVQLQIRPRAGDTLHMRFDQQMEVTGTTRVGKADSTMSVVSLMRVRSRVIVQKSEPHATTALTITDSVSLSSAGGRDGDEASLGYAERAMRGTRVLVRLAPDGAVEVISGSEGVSPELRSLAAQFPATLPRQAVRVGETWQKRMMVPAAGQPAGAAPGVMTATFRLDSLGPGGRYAYISVRGSLEHAGEQTLPSGVRVTSSGTLTGSLVLDRVRGWLTDSRTTLNLRSAMAVPGDSTPMRFQMRVTQRMRAVDRD